jgi:hypothetical protein
VEPKKLSRILIDKGLVPKAVLDRLLGGLAPDQTLADRLVTDAIVSEADLLRALAQASGTKFISSPRLNDLQLSGAVLEFIPVAAAQANDVLPIAFNAAAKALTVVIADPDRVSALDDLPRVGKLDQVVANIAMPGAIRAAIRRAYGLERKPAKAVPVATGACPQCQEPYFGDQLECGNCGLLLNANAPTDNSEAKIVRALLSQPSGLHRVRSRTQVHEGMTRRGFVQPIADSQVPQLVAGLDIARSLSDFEAFMISFIDGQMTVGELSSASGLMSVEVHSVLASLSERKVIELRDSPPPPPPPTDPELPVSQPVPDVPPLDPPTPPVPHEPVPGRAANPRRERARPPKSKPMPPIPAAPARPAAPPPPAPVAAVAPVAKPAAPLLPPRHLDPNVQMENSLQHALALERRGQVDGAISVLRIAVSRAPNPAPLYNRLALVILNQRQDARQAEQLIHKALELDPENPVYRANLVKVLGYAATQGKR